MMSSFLWSGWPAFFDVHDDSSNSNPTARWITAPAEIACAPNAPPASRYAVRAAAAASTDSPRAARAPRQVGLELQALVRVHRSPLALRHRDAPLALLMRDSTRCAAALAGTTGNISVSVRLPGASSFAVGVGS